MAQSSGFAFRLVFGGLTSVACGFWECTVEKIRLLFQPGACKLSTASDPLSQSFHRILLSHASSTIDLIVNMDSQDCTQTSWRTNVSRGDHGHLVVRLVPGARRFSQNKHTRIHRMLKETELLNEEPLKRSPPLLWLISQAVPSLDLKKLVGMHALFEMRLRHGHVERSLRPLLSATRNAACMSPIGITKRHEAINCRVARLFVDNVGFSVFRSLTRST